MLGKPFMPWQLLVVTVALEVQSEAAGDPSPGEWAYSDVTVTTQRQAGKTTLLRPVVAHRCGAGSRRRVFMTAQKRETARKRWMDTTDDFLTSPLRDEVRRKTARMGEELRWRRTQSTCIPFGPDSDDLHGETPDLVTVDELWAFAREQARALQASYVPGFTTKDGQAWKLSTAGTEESWWLNQARRAGRLAVESGVRLGVAYFEWSLPDLIDGRRLEDLADDELVQACIDHHPANGHTLRPASLWAAWTEMGGDRTEFLRAYANRTQADSSREWRGVSESTWLAQIERATSGIPADSPLVVGVWVDRFAEDAAVAVAWRDQARHMHVEIPHRSADARGCRVGYRWVAGYVASLAVRSEIRAVAVSNVGPGRDVADELEAAGMTVVRVSQADWPAACWRHRSELEAGSWWHAYDGDATAAARAAGWRAAGGGHAWDRDHAPISALAAQTVAGWGFDHAPAPEPTLPPFRMR